MSSTLLRQELLVSCTSPLPQKQDCYIMTGYDALTIYSGGLGSI